MSWVVRGSCSGKYDRFIWGFPASLSNWKTNCCGVIREGMFNLLVKWLTHIKDNCLELLTTNGAHLMVQVGGCRGYCKQHFMLQHTLLPSPLLWTPWGKEIKNSKPPFFCFGEASCSVASEAVLTERDSLGPDICQTTVGWKVGFLHWGGPRPYPS